MESIENGSLQNQIDIRSPKKKYYTSNAIFAMISPLIPVLEFAARNKIFHSDLKPANIYITPDRKPKIADFGASVPLSTEYGNSPIQGTPEFFSYAIRSAWMESRSSGQSPDFKHDPEKSDVMSLAITVIDLCLLKIVTGINDLDTYEEV